jgi:hypothetical protein
MKIFNEGERVCSTLMGFYSGLPGTIIRAVSFYLYPVGGQRSFYIDK